MHRLMMMLGLLVALVGCDRGSVVPLGQARAPTRPEAVVVYTQMPANVQQLGLIHAETTSGWTTQQMTDSAMTNLKSMAAELGANGVVVQGLGQSSSPGGMVMPMGGGQMMFMASPGYPRVVGTAIWVP